MTNRNKKHAIDALDKLVAEISSCPAPEGPKLVKHDGIKRAAKSLMSGILSCTSPGEEQTYALRHLRECLFATNAAIASKAAV